MSEEFGQTDGIRRRDFLRTSTVLALLGTITIKVIGCDGEKDTVVSLAAETTPRADVVPEIDSQMDDQDEDQADDEMQDAGMNPNPPPGPDPVMCQDINNDSTVDFGHSHPFSLSAADQEAGQGVSLTLQCAAGHKHTVNLSGAEVTSICDGDMVVKESSLDAGHTHSVMFNV